MPHTDTGRAVIAATPDEVFAALLDAEARAVWLPPTGMTGRFEWFDARPGGGYRMVLRYEDPTVPGKSEANTDITEVRFVAIEAPSRVVEEADFVADDPRFAGTMTMTWTVAPHPSGSLVTITATDVPDGIDSADHTTAFASTLANLEAWLRAQELRPRKVAE